jgi:hypothetical protein
VASAARERVIRVGVTGHRAFAEPEAVAERVRAGLRHLLALAADGTAGARVQLELLSPVAEGADRLVAREVLVMPGASLVATLPFAADDYASDFDTPASRREFDELLARARSVQVMPEAASRDAGYEQVGRWVADHCDVLIALWDGRPSRGPGGTADIIAYAAERGVPLLWVPVIRT